MPQQCLIAQQFHPGTQKEIVFIFVIPTPKRTRQLVTKQFRFCSQRHMQRAIAHVFHSHHCPHNIILEQISFYRPL